jgi:hypothetical protein
MLPPILQRAGSPFFLAESTHHHAHGWRQSLQSRHPHAVLRVLRGQKSKTFPALFDEWSAALQFPYYCAGNWGAFEEALLGLRLISPAPHVLLVTYGLELLAEAPGREFQALFEICQRVHESWSRPSVPENIPAQVFHVVLQETAPSLDVLAEKLASHGVSFQSLDLNS